MKYKGNGSQILDTHRQYEEKPMKDSLAISYAMKKKRKKMAAGGEVDEDAPNLPGAGDFQSGFRKKTHYAEGGEVAPKPSPTPKEKPHLTHEQEEELKGIPAPMAEGGEVHEGFKDDLVNRIMKKLSPGQEANATPPIADELPAEYDDLVLDDNLESTYGDDDNSGDALGNAQEDEDRRDIVSRIMASRKKKDRLPNPR